MTGRKKFAMDLQVPDALPTMVCRPPTINGTVRSVANLAEVRAMPGVTDVVTVSTGVAVRGRTFGQCIDAVRALRVDWRPGTAEGASDATVLAKLRRAELPLVVPPLPLLTKAVDARFTFHFASNAALETNCAIADVRADSAEIWASSRLRSSPRRRSRSSSDCRSPPSASMSPRAAAPSAASCSTTRPTRPPRSPGPWASP